MSNDEALAMECRFLLLVELAMDFAGEIEARALLRGIFAGGELCFEVEVLFVLLGN